MTIAQTICTDALEELGVASINSPAQAEYLERALRNLNRLLKANQGSINFLYTRGSFNITTESGYALSERPAKIFSATLVSGETRSPLTMLTRKEFDALPSAKGTPVNFYYDMQVSTPVFYLWPSLEVANGESVEFTCERKFTDMGLASDIDLPSEWEDAIVLKLADRLQNVFMSPVPGLYERADAAWRMAEGFDAEGSVSFSYGDDYGMLSGGYSASSVTVSISGAIDTNALAAYDALFGSAPHEFALNKVLVFTGENSGNISHLLQMKPNTAYERPAITWYDFYTDEPAVSLYAHNLNHGNDAAHKALEIKTDDGGGNMITREAISYGEVLAKKDYYAIVRVNYADATGQEFLRVATDNDVNSNEVVVIYPEVNREGYYTVAGSRAVFGYDGSSRAIVQGGQGKGITFKVDETTDAMHIDSDGSIRAQNGFQFKEVNFGSLPAPTASNKGHYFTLRDALPAECVTRGTMTAGGGTESVLVKSDGTNWRYVGG